MGTSPQLVVGETEQMALGVLALLVLGVAAAVLAARVIKPAVDRVAGVDLRGLLAATATIYEEVVSPSPHRLTDTEPL